MTNQKSKTGKGIARFVSRKDASFVREFVGANLCVRPCLLFQGRHMGLPLHFAYFLIFDIKYGKTFRIVKLLLSSCLVD